MLEDNDPRELTDERLKALREKAKYLYGEDRITEEELTECLDYIDYLLERIADLLSDDS